MNLVCYYPVSYSWLTWGEGKLDDGIVVKIVSPRGALLRIFGLPSELQCLGLSEGG